MKNDISSISDTLSRELALRSFNRNALKIETAQGSDYEKLIGVGTRPSADDGRPLPYPEVNRNYFREVVEVFEELPIHQYFGITIDEAMDMPIPRWTRLVKAAVKLRDKNPKSNEKVLMEVVKELMMSRGLEGGAA